MISLDEIRDRLDRGEFFLEYMPTIRLSDGHCVGGEALTRWRRPSGIVPPMDFIPQIERTPVAGLLTYWVIETVAAELGEWLRRTEDVHLAINVPPEILGRGGLEHVAVKSGLSDLTSKIVLGITERGILNQIGVDAIISRSSRIQGLRLAVDDVGSAGYGLAVVSHVAADIVKLDKSIIDGLLDGSALPVIEAIAKMSKAAGFQAIAEGVEHKEQFEALRHAGISMAQGWHFSRSLPVDKFFEFHAAKAANPPLSP